MSGTEGPVEVSLRAMDVDVVVELSGTGAAELAPLVRAAWSRCLAAPRVDGVGEPHVRVPVTHAAGSDPARRSTRSRPRSPSPRSTTRPDAG